jgi:hypothetical protein
MQHYPKNIRRLLREYMIKAYAQELHRELAKLDLGFAQWRDGKIDSSELSYRVHQFEMGASRELYKKYNNSYDDMNVAYAIVTGILNRDEIPAELLESLSSLLVFYQSHKDKGDLKEPGE